METIKIVRQEKSTSWQMKRNAFLHFFLHDLPISPWLQITGLCALSCIVFIILMLLRDFEFSMKQAYYVQNTLYHYQASIQKINNPNELLLQTLILMNTLQQSIQKKSNQTLFSIYSSQSQQKTDLLYYQALQNIFLPEIKRSIENYLLNYTNQKPETLYAVLQTYLMLSETKYRDDYFINRTLFHILPNTLNENDKNKLIHYLQIALNTRATPVLLNTNIIESTRNFFKSMSDVRLAFLILNSRTFNEMSAITLTPKTVPTLFLSEHPHLIASIYTAKYFFTIISSEAETAMQEALTGNWILGHKDVPNKKPDEFTSSVDELRSMYVAHYVDTWESLLNNIHLNPPNSLAETDAMIHILVSDHSPLLQLLETIHTHTYFEPVILMSNKLKTVGEMFENKNLENNTLFLIFSSLKDLHNYLEPILKAKNEKKAAFDALAMGMRQHHGQDVFTKIRLAAEKSPEPIRGWLAEIANDAWHFLMVDASQYMDVSVQNKKFLLHTLKMADNAAAVQA